jgi:hypothetical protein
LNPGPPEYEAGVLNTQPQCLFPSYINIAFYLGDITCLELSLINDAGTVEVMRLSNGTFEVKPVPTTGIFQLNHCHEAHRPGEINLGLVQPLKLTALLYTL